MKIPAEPLQKILDKIVSGNKMIPGAILSVCTGDKSLNWTGAAGHTDLSGMTPVTPETPFFIASVTKLVTTAAIFILIDQGRLELDDIAARYIPSTIYNGLHTYKDHDYTPRITIRHLLSHTSGIADYFSGKPKTGLSFMETANEEIEKIWSPTETILFAQKKLKPYFPPGKGCRYSDTNFQLLGIIIETISGISLEKFFHKEIFEPLRMDRSWMYHRTESLKTTPAPIHPYFKKIDGTTVNALRASWADGGVIATADDCLKFYRAFLSGRIFRRKNLQRPHNWHRIMPFVQYSLGTMLFNITPPLRPFFHFSGFTGHTGATSAFLLKARGYDLYLAGSFNQSSYNFFLINTLARITAKIIRNGAVRKEP